MPNQSSTIGIKFKVKWHHVNEQQMKEIVKAEKRIHQFQRAKIESPYMTYLSNNGVDIHSEHPFSMDNKGYVQAMNFLQSELNTVNKTREYIREMASVFGIEKDRHTSYNQLQTMLSSIWSALSEYRDYAASEGIWYDSNQTIELANKVISGEITKTKLRNMNVGEWLQELINASDDIKNKYTSTGTGTIDAHTDISSNAYTDGDTAVASVSIGVNQESDDIPDDAVIDDIISRTVYKK